MGLPRLSAILCLGLTLILLAACSPPRSMESLQVMSDLASGEVGDDSRRTTHPFTVDGRRYDADLYLPVEPAQAVLVLLPGVTPDGKDDRRLVTFAHGLAEAEFVVLVPDIPSFRALKVGPSDAAAVQDAVRYASSAFVDDAERGVALGAISYAAGPALLALLDPDTRARTGLFVAIGGYYDTLAVVTFFTTGAYRYEGETAWRTGAPSPWGKWIFARSNLDRLSDAGDRALLDEMAERKLGDETAAVDDLVAALGSEGRSVYALLSNDDPDRVPDLVEALPSGVRADMAGLSLANRPLETVDVPAILLHGRDDPVIPASESAALAAALPEGRAQLYVVDNFAHVAVADPSLRDVVTMWRGTYALLQARDALPRPVLEAE